MTASTSPASPTTDATSPRSCAPPSTNAMATPACGLAVGRRPSCRSTTGSSTTAGAAPPPTGTWPACVPTVTTCSPTAATAPRADPAIGAGYRRRRSEESLRVARDVAARAERPQHPREKPEDDGAHDDAAEHGDPELAPQQAASVEQRPAGGKGVGGRQGLGERPQDPRQGGDRIEDARQRQHYEQDSPRQRLGPGAEPEHEGDDEQGDHPADDQQHGGHRDQADAEVGDVEGEEAERRQ